LGTPEADILQLSANADELVINGHLPVPDAFSLTQTCGPVAWVGERSPRHRWANGTLTWIGWDDGRIAWRQCRQRQNGMLDITGTAPQARDGEWASAVLGIGGTMPDFPDPVMNELAGQFPGLRAYCDGSLFDGIVTSIVGQSISVAAAAVTQAKLATSFAELTEIDGRAFRPLPSAWQLAEASLALIRASGVTWKRAEGIQYAARQQIAGALPSDAAARERPDDAVRALMELPLVGRWTAESAVLWGIGAPDAHPTGDIALLRATRQAYGNQDLTLKDLDRLSDSWRPGRGIAARLLWTALFGTAPSAKA
jgi:3-methyladenine DNA glycosylase/8-oxoguanine DNA glycosylase